MYLAGVIYKILIVKYKNKKLYRLIPKATVLKFFSQEKCIIFLSAFCCFINIKGIVHPKIKILSSVCQFCHSVLYLYHNLLNISLLYIYIMALLLDILSLLLSSFITKSYAFHESVVFGTSLT